MVVITARPEKVQVIPMTIGPRPKSSGFTGGGNTGVLAMMRDKERDGSQGQRSRQCWNTFVPENTFVKAESLTSMYSALDPLHSEIMPAPLVSREKNTPSE
jgi:hypothetical protein